MTTAPLAECLSAARRAALAAWGRICHFYDSGIEVSHKPEGPVTEADRLADQFIVASLEAAYPRGAEYGYLSEEFENDPSRLGSRRVWMIDPIDGTKYFIRGSSDFAVMIGMTEAGADAVAHPVLGVVYHPLEGRLYTSGKGLGAWVEREVPPVPGRRWFSPADPDPGSARWSDPERLRVDSRPGLHGLRAILSGSKPGRRLQALIGALPLESHRHMGSLGLKLMEVASGQVDFYVNPERGKAMEWDLCAPQAILEEAGGRVSDLEGRPMAFNRPDVRLDHGIVATNGVCHDELVEALSRIPELHD